MNLSEKFIGTGIALVTPFKDGLVDYESLGKVIDYVIAGGVNYVVSLGTTGEAVTLSMQECQQVKDYTVEKVAGRVPVVFGLFGGSYTARICERIQQYDLNGIAALLSSSPNYIKPTQEGIFQHYKAIATVSPLPIILYNVPGRTASNIEAATAVRIHDACPNIIGIKEASGDMYQGALIFSGTSNEFLLLSGDDLTTLPLIAVGGKGVISVIGNAFPKTFSRMVDAALQQDYPTAQQLNNVLLKMYKWIFVEGNPAGIKYVLSELGLCTPEVRLPLTSLTGASARAMAADLQQAIAFEKAL